VQSAFEKSSHHPTGEVVLEVRNLKALPAVHDASFTLRRGEILGIAGLVGSGRTELLRELMRRDRRYGFLTEDRKGEGVIPHFSLAANITFTRPLARAGWIRKEMENRAASAWMARLRIRSAGPDADIRQLSGGNQQKVLLARLMHQDADVLLLDEPTR